MIKKIFLMTVVGLIATPEKITTKNNNNAQAVAVIGGACLLGTAVYWASRESNDSLIARAEKLLEQNKLLTIEVDACLSQESNLFTSDIYAAEQSIKRLYDKLSCSCNQLSSVYNSIKNRYDSFLTPWNWSDAMCKMCDDLSFAIKLNTTNKQNIEALLNKAVHLSNVASYQKLLQSMTVFMKNSKNFLEKTIVTCETLHDVEQLFIQKKSIQKDLDLLFLDYQPLNNQLDAIASILSVHYRNQQVEKEFKIIEQQALCLRSLLAYSSCIVTMDKDISLIREVRKFIGEASYPMQNFVNKINADINNLLSFSLILDEKYTQLSLDVLRDLKSSVIASNEYIAERHAYEIYLEQKRQSEAAAQAAYAAQRAADAAQRQAKAAQEAVDAAYRKARAIEEQNRLQEQQNILKKEENRINAERNKIERNKQQNNNSDDRW